MIPRSEDAQRRHLEHLEAKALEAMIVSVGIISKALSDGGAPSGEIEDVGLLAARRGRLLAASFYDSRPSLADKDAWNQRQEEAVDRAEATFATIINLILALRDGDGDEEVSE